MRLSGIILVPDNHQYYFQSMVFVSNVKLGTTAVDINGEGKMEDRVTIIFDNQETGYKTDLEVPLSITANDLILALNNTYKLNMDTDNIFHCYLVSENPISFLRGNKLLADFGIHTGTKIIYRRGQK